MKRRVMTGLVILSMLLSTSLVNVQASKAKKPQVAVILMALNSDYWNMVSVGAKKAAVEGKVDVSILGPSTETAVPEQVAMIETQISKNVDAIVLAALQPPAVLPALQKANKRHIPIILIDTGIPQFGEQKSYVGTENIYGGEKAGNYLAKKLGKGAKVAIVRGIEGSPTHDDRANGCINTLKAKGINVVTIQPANSDRGLAMTVTENILKANPDIKGIYATNDEMAMGALKAVQGAKKNDIIIVGFDGQKDALQSISSGQLNATVAQHPIQEGYDGVKAAIAAIKGKKVNKRIDTGTDLVTIDNVKAFQNKIDRQMK